MIASYLSAVTSADTGPLTMSQISRRTSSNRRPVLETRVGFVVTPSARPIEAASRMSLMSAVSMKNFMVASVARWDSTHYYHCKTMTELRIGTVDVPARIERERYFTELSYL